MLTDLTGNDVSPTSIIFFNLNLGGSDLCLQKFLGLSQLNVAVGNGSMLGLVVTNFGDTSNTLTVESMVQPEQNQSTFIF
jgi:hypothetical protein